MRSHRRHRSHRRKQRAATRRRLIVGASAVGCVLIVSLGSGLALGRFTTSGMNRYAHPMLSVRTRRQYKMVYDASENIFATPGRHAPTGGRIVRARQSYIPAAEPDY